MKNIFYFCLLTLFFSCSLKEEKKATDKLYFDLEGYFIEEATRLAKENPTITKTVMVNDKVEKKQVKLDNWKQEFGSFISADINKASWKGSFRISKAGNLVVFSSENEKIPVKKVEITYQHKTIQSIKILIVNTNILYTSGDILTYYPDSLYEIKKTQQIKLMKEKRYQVTGKFK
jgi:hypothetical protein